MLSLTAAFWIMVALFAFVGMMRGWTKEVLVISACILAIFVINQFMGVLFNLIHWDTNVAASPELRKRQFYIMSTVLLAIVFFGYQGPTLAGSRVGDRLTRRDNWRDRILGLLVGGLNGWFVIGTVWSFLEYQLVSASNWVRFTPDVPYPFNPTTIIRPAPELATIIDNLPIPILTQSPLILPLMLAAIVLFILVVLV